MADELRKAAKADKVRAAIAVREQHQFFIAFARPCTFVLLTIGTAVVCRLWLSSDYFSLVLLLATLLLLQSTLTLLLHRSWQMYVEAM